jgi:hypothetical protein
MFAPADTSDMEAVVSTEHFFFFFFPVLIVDQLSMELWVHAFQNVAKLFIGNCWFQGGL